MLQCREPDARRGVRRRARADGACGFEQCRLEVGRDRVRDALVGAGRRGLQGEPSSELQSGLSLGSGRTWAWGV